MSIGARGIGWRTGFAVATVSAALGASIAFGIRTGGPNTPAPGPRDIHAHLLPYRQAIRPTEPK
jgi:hypothetical protein